MRFLITIIVLVIAGSLMFVSPTIADIQPVSAITGFWGNGESVDVNGNIAYVGTQFGVAILDISDPSNPTQISFCSLPVASGTKSVVYSAGKVFALMRSHPSNLVVIDVENPEDPQEISRISDLPHSTSFCVDESYAYLGSTQGLKVFDISDPAELSEIANCDTLGLGTFLKMVKSGDFMYANQNDRLWVYDVANPEHPRVISSIPGYNNLYSFDVYGNNAIIGHRDAVSWQLKIMDITNPAEPTEIDTIYTIYPRYIEVSNDGLFAYLTDGGTVQVINFQDGFDNGHLGGSCWFPGSIRSMVVTDYLYLSTNSEGLRVMDLDDPEEPGEFGCFNEKAGSINTIVSDGDMAFTVYRRELHLVDISNPRNPGFIQIELDMQYIRTISTHDQVLYVEGADSSNQECIKIFDIMEDDIRERGSLDLHRHSDRIINTDQYLFRISYDSIRIVDIQNPDEPFHTGVIPSNGCRSATVAGNYLYGTSDVEGLQIYSINNPRRPHLVSTLQVFGYARYIAVSGDIAFVSQYDPRVNPGLRLIDIHDPIRPSDFDSYSTPGTVIDMFIEDGLLYLSCGEGGVSVVDVRDPQNPIEIDTYDTPGFAYSSTVHDSLIIVADWSNLGIYSFSSLTISKEESGLIPLEFYLSPSYPNPFNSITRFTYNLPENSHASLRVFDLGGHEVATIFDTEKVAGNYQATWDGSGIPSGIYMIRLEAGNKISTQKVVLVR
jgi:hypothetical protein